MAHAPDFFARRSDGLALVLDCRPVEGAGRGVAKFDATAKVCTVLGWQYRLVGAADPIRTAKCAVAGRLPASSASAARRDRLRSVFATPTPPFDGAETVGDPLAVLPVLFHMLWCGELAVELSAQLHPAALVCGRVPG